MASELSSEIFMEEIRNYPCLRCKFCKDFKDKYIKLNSWKSVGDKFGLPLDAVVKNYKNCFWIRSSRSTNACRISAFGLASVIHRHPHTEQANASPSNDNNLDIETAFSITEDICADQFILDESYNNKSTTSACTTDVKSVPGRLVTRKKTEIGEVDKAILKSVNSFHKSIIAGQKKKRESDDEVELFCFSLVVSTL